jgi:hypothetical protein
MRIVYHDARAVALADFHHFGQRGDVTAHAVHAVHHHQLARFGRQVRQHALQAGDVVVQETLHFGAAHHARIHDAGMVILVDDDIIVFAQDRRDGAHVGLVAGGKYQRSFLAHIRGQAAVQLQMQFQRAVQEARPGHAGAISLHSVDRCLAHARIGRQPQIIVGADHHHFLAFEHGNRAFGVA